MNLKLPATYVTSVPFYVFLYGFLGAMAYVFTSLLDAWETWEGKRNDVKKLWEDEQEKKTAVREEAYANRLKELLDKYDGTSFEDKMKEFGIERKVLRIIATLPVCAGVYLLYALLIAPPAEFGLTSPNTTVVNATLSDIVKLIETQNKAAASNSLIAGVSFLTGLYIKTILTAMGSLANRLTGNTPEGKNRPPQIADISDKKDE
ncbi:MAG: hypothetical protein O8C61_06415 [Candidatus Methanoperedens sp.]|nr:hypothetical protein [Candidatus Methanoperedens sp.]